MIRTIQEKNDKISFLTMIKAMKRNQQISSLFIILILSTLIYFCLTLLGTYMHEQVHGAINKQYGMNSEYGWEIDGIMLHAYTKATIPEGYKYSELCNETCKTLHMQNEIVTYNIEALSQLIFLVFIMFLLYNNLNTFDKELFYKQLDAVFEEKNGL